MIKYLELTAPEASAFRQAKILSIECEEGQAIKEGDTLFLVKSGESEIPLPSTKDGKVIEIIAAEDENITISTPLILIETIVEKSTASKPIETMIDANASEPMEGFGTSLKDADESNNQTIGAEPETKNRQKNVDESKVNGHEQQTLDLMLSASDDKEKHDQARPGDNQEVTTMSELTQIEVTVPDIGTDSAKVIEILVQAGDEVMENDSLVTLESDKASMDVPSPSNGTIETIEVEIDQDVSEGTLIVTLSNSQKGNGLLTSTESNTAASTDSSKQTQGTEPNETAQQVVEVKVPDIGSDTAKVIEILVAAGDEIAREQSLVTLESDKASMDVPSDHAGIIDSIQVNIDDEVSEGSVIVTLKSLIPADAKVDATQTPQANLDSNSANKPGTTVTGPASAPSSSSTTEQPVPAKPSGSSSHATPSVRRFARELGVDLSRVNGSGRKGRILADDVKLYVKGVVSSAGNNNSQDGIGIPKIPPQDFSKFGETERVELNKIKRLTASNLHRSWLNVPMVTHHDEANITSLESFRKQVNSDYKARGEIIKLSPLAFIVKALVRAMRTYPQFNASLEASGDALIYKKYFNIGIAVDTPNGLVVPVIKGADKKSVSEIAQEMADLAARARDKKLKPIDMSGACMTISSLGGIGGTSFTPIVNAPEVAILGVSRSKMAPVWNGESFDPALMLPLSLTYDHRVIDGAEAARFARLVAEILEDVRLLTV